MFPSSIIVYSVTWKIFVENIEGVILSWNWVPHDSLAASRRQHPQQVFISDLNRGSAGAKVVFFSVVRIHMGDVIFPYILHTVDIISASTWALCYIIVGYTWETSGASSRSLSHVSLYVTERWLANLTPAIILRYGWAKESESHFLLDNDDLVS